jgi:hypothetical protein
MAVQSTRRRGASFAIAASFIVACAGLVGCAEPAGASAVRAPASTSLCRTATRVERVVVRRVHGNPQLRIRFPARVVIVVPFRARQAAAAVCSLPLRPAGIFNCPIDFGVTYQLRFTADGKDLRPVTIQAGGCEAVSGLGRARWAARSPQFWRTLGSAAGIRHATFRTFGGAPR